jgi:hypothetical protein
MYHLYISPPITTSALLWFILFSHTFGSEKKEEKNQQQHTVMEYLRETLAGFI